MARLAAIDASADASADLVAAGIVRAPTRSGRYVPDRRIKAKAPVSELVAKQRRGAHRGMITYVDTSTCQPADDIARLTVPVRHGQG